MFSHHKGKWQKGGSQCLELVFVFLFTGNLQLDSSVFWLCRGCESCVFLYVALLFCFLFLRSYFREVGFMGLLLPNVMG